MQLTFSYLQPAFGVVENTLSKARLARYLIEAGGDPHYALRLYVWNASLCQALYLPVQICEVAVRNALHGALVRKIGPNWHEVEAFRRTLPAQLRGLLDDAIARERIDYGARMTVDHVVSGLSFGFWQNLLTARYDGMLWPQSFAQSFPKKPTTVSRELLYKHIDKFRILRNRLAHHKPIFDRGPSIEYLNMLQIVSWICPDTAWLMRHLSRVAQTINSRPKS